MTAFVSEKRITGGLNAEGLARRRQFGLDCLRFSQTLRRYAHDYKRWALDAEARGNLEHYRRYRKESDDTWRRAKSYFKHARMDL